MTALVLENCRKPEEALEVLRLWVANTALPQHAGSLKRQGGAAVVSGIRYWIWKTATGWHIEQLRP